ncbi:MAG: ComEC/Rec2 family competence protein, partial [Myxococcota bacterium]
MSDRGLGASVAAFGIGMLLAETGWAPPVGLLVAGLVCLCVSIVWQARTRPRTARALGWGLLVLAGALRLGLRFEAAQVDLVRLEQLDPQAVQRLEARVLERRAFAWGSEVRLDRVRALAPGPAPPRRLLLSLDAQQAGTRADRLLVPGAQVRFGARLDPIAGARNPGSDDRERAWARRGLAVQARLVDPAWVVVVGRETTTSPTHPTPPTSPTPRTLRARWLASLGPALAARPGGALALALVLGERAPVDPVLAAGLHALGLSHLVAISGLHVGLVGGAAGFLTLRLLGRRS